jgi:starvation-inducible DNA-binding protein
MMEPNVGISKENRGAVVQLLNTLLADEFLLYTKARNYHWNVTGPQFSELHGLFETQYNELNEIVDEVAERARALGGKATGTLSEFLKSARLREQPGQYPDVGGMLSNLLADYEAITRNLRNEIRMCADKYQDEGTAGFLTELIAKHEKTAWMLRAYIQSGTD